jgi:molybdopterin-biosynthesis enzyme MoeA-like protein
MVGDDAGLLEDTLRQTLAGNDVVFSFGGIGATPDDRTRQCAASAANVPLEFNAEGTRLLEERFGENAYPKRIHMVEWPVGAQVIPNPVNQVPGFSFGHHHFVPGFPKMAWPMVEWVLDTHYADLHREERNVELLIEALDTPESALIDLMQQVMDAHRQVRIACLPNASGQRSIEFGVRGEAIAADNAYEALETALTEAGVPLGRRSRR